MGKILDALLLFVEVFGEFRTFTPITIRGLNKQSNRGNRSSMCSYVHHLLSQLNICALQHFICTNFLQWCRISTFLCYLLRINFYYILCKISIMTMLELHLLKVLFGTKFFEQHQHQKNNLI